MIHKLFDRNQFRYARPVDTSLDDSFRSIIASPFLSKIVLKNVDDRDIESVQAVFPEATVTIGVRYSASEAGSGSTTATTAKDGS